jgi:hypothetical protein
MRLPFTFALLALAFGAEPVRGQQTTDACEAIAR